MRVPPSARARCAGRFSRHDGIHIEHEAAVDSAQSVDRARLSEKRGIRASSRSPRILESGMLHLPNDVQVPTLCISRLIFDTFKRNPDLDLVSIVGHAALRRE